MTLKKIALFTSIAIAIKLIALLLCYCSNEWKLYRISEGIIEPIIFALLGIFFYKFSRIIKN